MQAVGTLEKLCAQRQAFSANGKLGYMVTEVPSNSLESMFLMKLAFKNEGKRKIFQKTEVVHHQTPSLNQLLKDVL